jgi:ketosteroid isomerase-like protein
MRKHNKAEVESAMKQYDHLIQKMDTDSIALLYTEDGDLGNIAHGRDSIRKFLSGFKNVKVLSQLSTTETIQITGDTCIQKGLYHQTDVIGNDTLSVKGSYTTAWLWIPSNGWQIKRMDTKPVK